jgi:hypothetical protein
MNALDITDKLHSSVLAIACIKDLIGTQSHNAQINTDNLYFLLDILTEKQEGLIKQLEGSIRAMM